MSRLACVRRRWVHGVLYLVLAFSAAPVRAQDFTRISPEAADALGLKIIEIQRAELDGSRTAEETSVEVGEIEMESFVLFWMEEDIPPRVESIDVSVDDGEISTRAELTFDEENRTGNGIVDTLFSGTHTFFARGALVGAAGRGMFELREVRLDGVAIPLVVIDLLVAAFVTPKYPAVDLDAPFGLPWGIEAVRLVPGRARVSY